jgi:hypothetical protein
MPIKNISPDDLDAIAKANQSAVSEKYLPKENLIKKDEDVKDENENVILQTEEDDEIILKPKRSYFEPDPVPYRLISGNHFIKKNLTKNNEIYVRPWNTEDEIKITKITGIEDFNRICNEIFISCVKSDIDIYELSLVDKLPLFIFILVITYGSKVSIKSLMDCDICKDNDNIDIQVDLLKDLEYKYMPDDIEYPFIVKLSSYPKDDITIKYVYPSLKHEKFFVEQRADNLFESLRHIIIELKGKKNNGKDVTKNDLNDIIKFLNANDKNSIKKNISEMTKYGINLETEKYVCSNQNCVYNKEKKSVFLTFENILSSLFMKLK